MPASFDNVSDSALIDELIAELDALDLKHVR
jgi:hypothetical protein